LREGATPDAPFAGDLKLPLKRSHVTQRSLSVP
jgi:hypothetical protein